MPNTHRVLAAAFLGALVGLCGCSGGPEFAELEMDLWGEPRVQLFIGHKDRELQELVDAIAQMQSGH